MNATRSPRSSGATFDTHWLAGAVGRSGGGPGATRLARGLGWFSLSLGIAGAVLPGPMARLIGVRDSGANRAVIRAVGLREIASGLGIFTQRRPTGWLWARVAGDAMDLSYLTWALVSGEARRANRTLAALAAVGGVTIPDLLCSLGLARQAGRAGHEEDEAMGLARSITVNKPPEEVYRFWRDFQNLPRFMRHLESVEVTGDGRSHWRVEGPAGKAVEWDAEIVEDRPHELIAWRSLPGADVDNRGQVRFRPAPGGRGTEIHVEMVYDPPAGGLGKAVAKLFGRDADQQIYGDLRRFKQILETGEVVRSDAALEWTGLPQRPAQPPREARPPAMVTR